MDSHCLSRPKKICEFFSRSIPIGKNIEIGSRMSLPTKNNCIKLVSFQDTLVSSDTLVSFYRTSVKNF